MGEENVTNEQLVARIQAGVDVPGNMLRLWEQNRGYIALVAKNYQAFEDIEDLKQEGYIGLCRAVDEYKPQEGIAFMTYAGYWIRQQMRRYVENCSSVVRVPSHARAKAHQYEKIVDDHRKEYGCKPANDQLRRYFGDIQSNTIELARSASTGRIQSLDMSVGEDEDCTVGDLLPGAADVEAGRTEGGTVGNGGHVAGKTGGNYPDAVPAESHTQTDRRRTRLFGGDGKDA